jgi:hypothetical protein
MTKVKGGAYGPAPVCNITIIYNQDDNVRYVRMNDRHKATLVPSPMGDSVGHWEGDVWSLTP